MPGDALFLGIAQIAVVIAGFTAVTSALTPPGGSWSPGQRILQRAIVSTSFNVMLESLVPLIAFAWLGDQRAALTLAAVLVTIYVTWVVAMRFRQFLRARAFTRRVVLILVASWAAVALFASTIATGSVASYTLALCCQLLVSILSFYSLVSSASA
jgi:hypothetical protein